MTSPSSGIGQRWSLLLGVAILALTGCIQDPETFASEVTSDADTPHQCSDGFAYCESDEGVGTCIDPTTDPDHCGGCQHTCTTEVTQASSICDDGVCSFVCDGAHDRCDGQCLDVTDDPENCGQCGKVCRTGECDDGRCLPFDCDSEAAPFGGGTGTYSDPYTICSAQQLNQLGSSDAHAGLHFALGDDIDLALLGEGVPFNRVVNFHGSFDGFGFTIENLTIAVDDHYAGLFYSIHYLGEVSNLILEDVSVSGNNHVGTLAGVNSGTVSNVVADGAVTGHTWAGGLVGSNNGLLRGSSADVAVTGTGWGTAGFAGYNTGEIIDSQSTGDVHGSHRAVGGLVGQNDGLILDSVAHPDANGTITGTATSTGPVALVGGLVGENRSTVEGSTAHGDIDTDGGQAGGLTGRTQLTGHIHDSHATGNVTAGGDRVGGLVGELNDDAQISTSYATGDVAGPTNVGGLIGYGTDQTRTIDVYATGAANASNGLAGGLVGYTDGDLRFCYTTGAITAAGEDAIAAAIIADGDVAATDCYWDIETTGIDDRVDDDGDNEFHGSGLHTDDFADIDNFPGWDFETTWFMPGTDDHDGAPVRPRLQ